MHAMQWEVCMGAFRFGSVSQKVLFLWRESGKGLSFCLMTSQTTKMKKRPPPAPIPLQNAGTCKRIEKSFIL